MNKIANISFISLAVSVALLGTPQTLKADKCDDCSTTFKNCMKNCSSKNCPQDCGMALFACKFHNCPELYTVQNASMYTLNFFRANGTLIGTRKRWTPERLAIEESDFPITVKKDCPRNECAKDDYEITKGCFVLSDAPGGRTAPMRKLCFRRSAKNPENNKPKSPDRSSSENKKATPEDKKITAKEKSSPSVSTKNEARP